MNVDLVINKSCVLKNAHEVSKTNHSVIGILKERCTYKNPDYVRNEKYGYSNTGVPDYIYTFQTVGNDIHFPRGIYKEIANGLKNLGFSVTIHNKLNKGRSVQFCYADGSSVPLVVARPDQRLAINDLKVHKRGLLQAFTSFGKTPTIILLSQELSVQTTIIVHTTFLQNQWIKELVELFKYDPKKIGGCGGFFKKPRLGDINICLYQTLSKPHILPLYTKDTGLVVVDEVQRAAVDAFTECVRNFDAEYRIGTSANHKRKDGKEFIIEDHIGKVVHEAVEKATDSKILSYITTIDSDYFDYEYDWDKNHSALVTRLSKDKDRNILILKRCFMKLRLNKQVLIIVERKEQCFLLQGALEKKGVKVGVLAGAVTKDEIAKFDSNMAKHYAFNYDEKAAYEYIKKNSENKNLQVIIGTQKAEVGLSLRTMNHLIVSSLVTSNIEDRLNQIIGRIERTHGKELEKLYGVKETPTADIIMDTKFKHIKKQKDKVKSFFKGRITELSNIKK